MVARKHNPAGIPAARVGRGSDRGTSLPVGPSWRGRSILRHSSPGPDPMPPTKKPRKRKLRARPTEVVGWREWVVLPELGIGAIKAKIDTGARSSSLHAYDMKRFKRRGVSMIRFKVHPIQRDARTVVQAEARLVDLRKVRSSSGVQTLRPVIVTPLELGGRSWEIEVTLVRRDEMGFRMLLGRQALRGHLLVDPGGSFMVSSAPSKAPSSPAGAEP
jgi:hypothetical protein